jgi:two-component system, sensor histidine kinase and response regulator
MANEEHTAGGPFQVLIVDDEPDIHVVTKMSLRGLKFGGKPVGFLAAATGKEAVEVLRRTADVGVVLLDVVMETESAGLDACRVIRTELENRFVRILLRTGQPGRAPEKQTIDEYDIDGYLPKAELSSTKLYSSVRTALKAYRELIELERHRIVLDQLNECVLKLRSFAPLGETLEQILATVVTLCPAPLAALSLETFDDQGNPRRFFLHLSTDPDAATGTAHAEAVRSSAARAIASGATIESSTLDGGYLVRLRLHRDLGHGYIYVEEPKPDSIARSALHMLAAHTENALYSSVAEAMMRGQQGQAFEAMPI